MEKKYEMLDDDTIIVEFRYALHRIRALRDFDNVKKGDLGGYIEKEENLSHESNCWVSDNAVVYGDAWVFDSAKISDNAKVYGNAWISGNATISGEASVSDNAQVSDNASVSDAVYVSGNAKVKGNANIYGNPTISDNALVTSDAVIFGRPFIHGRTIISKGAYISSNDDYFTICPVDVDMRTITFYLNKDKEIMVYMDGQVYDFDLFISYVYLREENPGTYAEKYTRQYFSLIKYAKEYFGYNTPKYKILEDNTLPYGDHVLYRIQALKSFDDVKAGDLGGFIEKESNLSQTGKCWIYDDAKVYCDAEVSGNAKIRNSANVLDFAKVSGNAIISDDAHVTNHAEVSGNAIMCGTSLICGDAIITDNASASGTSEIRDIAKVYGNTEITENAVISGESQIYDGAIVRGNAIIRGNAKIHGEAIIFNNTYLGKRADISKCNEYIVIPVHDIVSCLHCNTYITVFCNNDTLFVSCKCNTTYTMPLFMNNIEDILEHELSDDDINKLADILNKSKEVLMK